MITKNAPKSERSARTLPLDASVMAALMVLRKRQMQEKLAAGATYRQRVCRRDELGTVPAGVAVR